MLIPLAPAPIVTILMGRIVPMGCSSMAYWICLFLSFWLEVCAGRVVTSRLDFIVLMCSEWLANFYWSSYRCPRKSSYSSSVGIQVINASCDSWLVVIRGMSRLQAQHESFKIFLHSNIFTIQRVYVFLESFEIPCGSVFCSPIFTGFGQGVRQAQRLRRRDWLIYDTRYWNCHEIWGSMVVSWNELRVWRNCT